MLYCRENFIIKNMNEDINNKLDKIIELLNKVLEKQTATISYGNMYNSINAVGKEHNFPTPWNTPYKATKPKDELYD
jgi:hypothetical protein